MQKLVSSVELKKADGKPITFNFQFENGLPMKSILSMTYSIGLKEDTEELVVMCYIQDDTEDIDFFIHNISTFEKDSTTSELWIHFKEYYGVINIKKEYLAMLEQKNSYFQIYDRNEVLLRSLYNKIY